MVSLECECLGFFFPHAVTKGGQVINSFFRSLAVVLVWLSVWPCSRQGVVRLCRARGHRTDPVERLTSLCGWLSWQVISSLRAQLAEAQSSQEAQLREELQRADQKVQQKAHQVKEYEREVSVGLVLKVLHALSSGVG